MNFNHRSIFVGGSIEANGIASRLETAGIKTLVKSRSNSARLAGFAPAIPDETEVFVAASDLDRAKAILQDIS